MVKCSYLELTNNCNRLVEMSCIYFGCMAPCLTLFPPALVQSNIFFFSHEWLFYQVWYRLDAKRAICPFLLALCLNYLHISRRAPSLSKQRRSSLLSQCHLGSPLINPSEGGRSWRRALSARRGSGLIYNVLFFSSVLPPNVTPNSTLPPFSTWVR